MTVCYDSVTGSGLLWYGKEDVRTSWCQEAGGRLTARKPPVNTGLHQPPHTSSHNTQWSVKTDDIFPMRTLPAPARNAEL